MTTQTEQLRGQLTDRIREKSIELLGYDISQNELRLMPYIQYQLVNKKRLSPAHLKDEEKAILANWVDKGYILDGVTGGLGRPMMSEGAKLEVTKEFWNILSEIVYLGYVDLHEQENP